MVELGGLISIDVILFLLWPKPEAVILFSFGFIWNWTASQDMGIFFENKRYRFSMLKMVFTLQSLVVKPFKKFPEIVKLIPRIIPAGVFWGLVIIFAESDVPWWVTFLGSLAFELTQFETYFKKRVVEVP